MSRESHTAENLAARVARFILGDIAGEHKANIL